MQTTDTHFDILVLTAPLTVTRLPMHAPAILKAIAKKAGFSCCTVDLNQLTYQWTNKKKHAVLLTYFTAGERAGGPLSSQGQKSLDIWLSNVQKIIAKHQPKILALSLLTDLSRIATKLICQVARQHFPTLKIIIGGNGISNPDQDMDFALQIPVPTPVGDPTQISFAETLLQQKLIDYYLQGDAEHAFFEFLKGNTKYVGINQSDWKRLTKHDMANLDYPDYDDYDWSLYKDRVIGITGSNGCVRQCRFCDYIHTHNKYTWRTGENIFNEMVHQKQKYQTGTFHFSDSLLNGNMAEYRQLVTLLAEYNLNNPHDTFQWTSFMIIKSPAQFDDELWRLTAASGCIGAWIGLETLSEELRFDMNKKFTNQEVDFCIEKIVKYSIPTSFLLFVGYPTETQEHIDQSIKWLEDHQHLRQHFDLFFTEGMSLLTNSWIEQNRHLYQIELSDPLNKLSWQSPISNPEIRSERYLQIRDAARSLGYVLHAQSEDSTPAY